MNDFCARENKSAIFLHDLWREISLRFQRMLNQCLGISDDNMIYLTGKMNLTCVMYKDLIDFSQEIKVRFYTLSLTQQFNASPQHLHTKFGIDTQTANH